MTLLYFGAQGQQQDPAKLSVGVKTYVLPLPPATKYNERQTNLRPGAKDHGFDPDIRRDAKMLVTN